MLITIKLMGGAKKSFSTDKILLEKSNLTINELIKHLIQIKPNNTLEFDTKNLLIAVNGVDSSALQSYNTKVNDNDIDENAVKNSKLVFLEGYLWDEGEPKTAFDKAISLSKKTAMTLSDKFCVDRHKKNFLDLVINKLDITFANEQEILSLIDAKNFDEVISFAKQLRKLIVITRSDKGSIAIQNNDIFEFASQKNLKIIDLTGAGDLFAAGFLHGYINNLSVKESLKKGTEMASKIIQTFGARLKN